MCMDDCLYPMDSLDQPAMLVAMMVVMMAVNLPQMEDDLHHVGSLDQQPTIAPSLAGIHHFDRQVKMTANLSVLDHLDHDHFHGQQLNLGQLSLRHEHCARFLLGYFLLLMWMKELLDRLLW